MTKKMPKEMQAAKAEHEAPGEAASENLAERDDFVAGLDRAPAGQSVLETSRY